MVEAVTHSVEESIALGTYLAAILRAGDVVTLDGDLGAGKTHFTKGIAQSLGIKEEITSPTFPLLLEYEGTNCQFYHFDFYRLESEEQLEDIAWFELCDSDAITLVEWAHMFPDALPDERLEIEITVVEDEARAFHFCGVGETGRHREEALAELIQKFQEKQGS